MGTISQTLLASLVAYGLGSIPFGYLLYRFRRNDDIREIGSGNIGATNVLRAAGPLMGGLTLLLDAAKGYAAVWLAGRIAAGSPHAIAAAALLVIVGHCYPIFLNFRGGKGVATALGAFLAIDRAAVVICAAFWAFDLVAFGYVSLASMLAVAIFPVVLLWAGDHPLSLVMAAIACAGLILFRHRENIQRLHAGTEPRVALRRSPR